jgi:ADP-ribose pyrophosphatase YjhB (NUDIX family)
VAVVRFCSACGEALPNEPPVTCPACAADHWRNPKPCANAIVLDGDRVLLARRAHSPWFGGWGSPGGFCEAGEHPADTAIREVREETGLEVEIVGYLGVWVDEYSDKPGLDGNETINVGYYVARQVGGGIDLTGFDRTEVSELRWFALDDLPEPLAPPGTLSSVIAALRHWEGAPVLDHARPDPM